MQHYLIYYVYICNFELTRAFFASGAVICYVIPQMYKQENGR